MGQQPAWKRNLKNIGYLSAIALFGLAATGCSSGSSGTANQQVQVRVWRLDQDVDSFRDYIANFQKAHPTVKVTYSKKTTDGYEFSALKSLAGQQGPDIWSIPNDWLGDYKDQVLPLPDNFFQVDGQATTPKPVDAIKQYFPQGIYEQLLSDDGTQVLGFPSNVDTLQLYVNPAIFSTAIGEFRTAQGNNLRDDTFQPVKQLLSSPPATWNDLVSQVKYLTLRNGNTITRSAIALGTADNIPNSEDVLQLLMLQNGTKITSDDRKAPLFQVAQSTPTGGQVRPGENALTFFSSFSDPSNADYSWNPSMPSALDAFGQGKVAMVVAYSDFGKQLKVKYPQFSYDTVKVPQISAAQAPVNLIHFSVETVTKSANNPAAAFAFLKTYVDKSDMKSITAEQKLFSPYVATLKDQNTFASNQILTGKAVYKIDHPQFDDIFHQMIVDTSQDGISPADAVKEGGDQIDALLNPAPDDSSN